MRRVAGGMFLAVWVAACTPSPVVEATAMTIDRKCQFIVSDPAGTVSETVTDDCGPTADLKKARAGGTKIVSGKAKIEVSYVSPVDGSYLTGTVELDGKDDEFYTVKAGDTFPIRVSDEDHTRIWVS